MSKKKTKRSKRSTAKPTAAEHGSPADERVGTDGSALDGPELEKPVEAKTDQARRGHYSRKEWLGIEAARNRRVPAPQGKDS